MDGEPVGREFQEGENEDNNAENLAPFETLAKLREDTLRPAAFLRETRDICEGQGDVAKRQLSGNVDR